MKDFLLWIWFVVIQIISAAATLLGFVVLAPVCYLKWWSPKSHREFPDRTVDSFPWLIDAVYGNPEDGVTGPAWYRPGEDIRKRAYFWSALRNTADHLKYVFAVKDGPFVEKRFGKWFLKIGFNPSQDRYWPVLRIGKE